MLAPVDVDAPDVELATTELDLEFLVRLKVACEARKPLPDDVARWAIETLTEAQPSTAKWMERNRSLRSASYLMSGSLWSKSVRLAREVETEKGRRARKPFLSPKGASVTYHVQRAVRIDPETPASPRHLLRILAG